MHRPSSLPRVLFLCNLKRWRSPTAEQIFAEHPLTPELVEWAELIFVMERRLKVKLSNEFKP